MTLGFGIGWIAAALLFVLWPQPTAVVTTRTRVEIHTRTTVRLSMRRSLAIAANESAQDVADQLQALGAIPKAQVFLSALGGAAGALKPGIYMLPEHASLRQLATLLTGQ